MTIIEYNSCVDLFSDNVYRFILKNIRDVEKAKDVVQESFMKLWDKRKTVSFGKSRSYLFTTAYHTMIDDIRKEKNMVGYSEKYGDAVSVNNDYSDIQEILSEAVARLPEVQKSVVLLRDYEGYSYKEISDITGLNESQVKVYIFRARTFLKNYIGSLDRVI